MAPNYVAYAIPFFFALIGVELVAAWLLGRRAYRLKDAFSDLGCGITQQVLGVFWKAGLVGVYTALYHWRVVTLDAHSVLTWVGAFVAVDFLFYWWHRSSHVVNFLWAAHVVHHQSEDMNLAVALRQAPLTNFTGFVFYLPLALLGFPAEVFVAATAFNTLYQFWIHSELIPKLGPVEWVLNTASHHRVHHGINPRYLDKNYGGILIVWDRLFGTFEEESERVVYGTVEPLRSFDPLWAQVEPLVRLVKGSWVAPRFADKLMLWIAPPAWSPAGVPRHAPPAEVTPETRPKYDTRTTRAADLVALALLVLAVTAAFFFLLAAPELSVEREAVSAAVILGTLAAGAALIR